MKYLLKGSYIVDYFYKMIKIFLKNLQINLIMFIQIIKEIIIILQNVTNFRVIKNNKISYSICRINK